MTKTVVIENETWLDKVKNFATLVTAIASACTILFGIVVALASPYYTPLFERFVILENSVAELKIQIDQNFDRTGNQVASLKDDIDRLELKPRPVEYDEINSQTLQPCTVGSICGVKIRGKLTKAGENCLPPKINAFVRNHFGENYKVSLVNPPEHQFTKDFVSINYDFSLPSSGIQEGQGFFYIVSEYSSCSWDNTKSFEARTPLIPMVIKKMILNLPDSILLKFAALYRSSKDLKTAAYETTVEPLERVWLQNHGLDQEIVKAFLESNSETQSDLPTRESMIAYLNAIYKDPKANAATKLKAIDMISELMGFKYKPMEANPNGANEVSTPVVNIITVPVPENYQLFEEHMREQQLRLVNGTLYDD